MENIITFIEQIEDQRNPKGKRHNQTVTILIMIMAIMCGHTGFNAMARFAKSHRETLLKFMPLPRKKVPSSSTFQRLTKAIDFEQLCNAFNNWMIQYCEKEGIAIDGKSINSTVSSCHDHKQNFVSLVSFFGQESNLIWHVGKLENGKSSFINKSTRIIKSI